TPHKAIRHDQKNEDQETENEGITVGTVSWRHQADEEYFGETEQVAAQNRADEAPDAPDHRRDEGLEAGHEPHERVDLPRPARIRKPGEPRQGATQGKGRRDRPVHANTHEPRG